MGKREFLDGLREALRGELAPELVEEHLRFYEEYIETERRKGREEEEIIGDLGEPRLIAKTLIDTSSMEELRGSSYGERREEGTGSGRGTGGFHSFSLSGRKALLVLAAAALGLLLVFFLILLLIGRVIFAFAPVILVLFVIWSLIRIRRKW